MMQKRPRKRSRKGQRSKSENQRRHANKRARERVGYSFGPEEQKEVISLIQSGKAEVVYTQSHRITIFRLTYKNIDTAFVYDKNRKNIVTLYPYETCKWNPDNGKSTNRQ